MARVCVIAPNWVGDAVMSEVLVARLHRRGDEVDVVAVPWVKPVYEVMSGVQSVIDNPLRHGRFPWKEARLTAKMLSHRAYDRAFILPPSLKSALMPYWAKIPMRTGYLGESRYLLLNDIRSCAEDEPCTNRYAILDGLSAHAPLERPQLTVSRTHSLACAQRLGLSIDKPILCLGPGAEFGPAKRWPARYFAAVGARFVAQGGVVWLLGSPKDKTVAQEIMVHLPQAVNLCGQTHLLETIFLLPLVACVVANDSGLMHMSCALSRPTVAIYGSTDPAFAPPTGHLSSICCTHMPCAPCRQRVCPLHHHDCMLSVSIDAVWSEVVRWVSRQA